MAFELENLRKISTEAIPKKKPDPLAKGEEELFYHGIEEAKLERLLIENSLRKENIRIRGVFSGWIFKLLVFWLLAVLGVIILVGFGLLKIGDNVLIALITSTTLNVIGLAGIVMRYFFPRR